jgi:hypothetical protein
MWRVHFGFCALSPVTPAISRWNVRKRHISLDKEVETEWPLLRRLLHHEAETIALIMQYIHSRRSQWPWGLRHEMSSPARTLGSWVRIPLKEWMSICVYSVFVRLRPCDGLIPRPRSPTDCLRLRNWSEMKCFTDVVCSKWKQQE